MNAIEFIHNHGYTNYCEAVVMPDGDVEYAVPSHIYYLENAADKLLQNGSRIRHVVPITANPILWLSEHLNAVVLWYNFSIIPLNITDSQIRTVSYLADSGLIDKHGRIKVAIEKSHCKCLDNGDLDGLKELMNSVEHFSSLRDFLAKRSPLG